MKKKLIFIIFLFATINAYTQTNNTVDVSEEIYEVLNNAELQGLCSRLSNVKPYTEKYIYSKLCEIEENLKNEDNKKNKQELKIIEYYKNVYQREEGFTAQKLDYQISGIKNDIPVSINVDFYSDSFVTGGIYSNKNINSIGYEIFESLKFFGDLGNNISYSSQISADATYMPLKELGKYTIGYWWYDWDALTNERKITTYRNYSVLPYSYKKKWDGSVYYFKGGMNAAGLRGWAFNPAAGFSILGGIHGSFFDDLVNLEVGRINREWGAMDTGSSLILNKMAHPFTGIDLTIKPFDWISISGLTGFLEYPNQEYVLKDAWYQTNGHSQYYDRAPDSFFFHNIFSIAMLDIDFDYLHWDFGGAVIYPNRFELGYMIPFIGKLLYQNNIGDYDNLSMFTNLKFIYPGYGSIWGSFFLDEMNSLTAKIFTATRCMFAYQGGAKIINPLLPFSSISIRYTKVEPFCYTHQALGPEGGQPYHAHYISESYTNNGDSLGYYLQPNSDEILVKFDTKFLNSANLSLQYQFIRHGVDWGSDSYTDSGSSIYSELRTGGRGSLTKYFLHDGTYEWMNIVSLTSSYAFDICKVPVEIYSTLGYVHNWFTSINGASPSKNTKYSKINTAEYQENRGAVMSLGVKIFK